MDARKHKYLLLCHGLTIVFLLTGIQTGHSQNVYKDYVTDACSQYSPFDYQQRGLVYRVHTGHAGIFGNCDDDRQKMVSPYIEWHCRPRQPNLAIRFVKDLFNDTFRKSTRIADGAGACVWGRCHRCQQSVEDCQCQPNAVAKSQPGYEHPSTRLAQSERKPVGQFDSNQSFLDFSRRSESKSQPNNQTLAQGYRARSQESIGQESIAYSARTSTASLYRSSSASARYRQSPVSNESYLQAQSGNNTRPTQQNGLSYFAGAKEDSSRNSYQPTNRKPAEQNYQAQKPNSVDPRFGGSRKLVPEDKFGAIEQKFGEKKVVDRNQAPRGNSMFKLSSGGVYSRPTTTQQSVSGTQSLLKVSNLILDIFNSNR